MQVLYERCAGIDVQQKTVVATILLTDPTGRVTKRTKTFLTMPQDVLALEAWLGAHQVEQVAIESTGIRSTTSSKRTTPSFLSIRST